MNGGSLFVLLDRHVQQIPTQQEMFAGAQPTWEPIETGLEALLSHWGAEVTDRIVLDEESFVSRQGNQQQQLFQVPIISGEGVNLDSVVTSGLEDVIVLNAAEILTDAPFRTTVPMPMRRRSRTPTNRRRRPTPRCCGPHPASWTVDSPSAVGSLAPRRAALRPIRFGETLRYFWTAHLRVTSTVRWRSASRVATVRMGDRDPARSASFRPTVSMCSAIAIAHASIGDGARDRCECRGAHDPADARCAKQDAQRYLFDERGRLSERSAGFCRASQ